MTINTLTKHLKRQQVIAGREEQLCKSLQDTLQSAFETVNKAMRLIKQAEKDMDKLVTVVPNDLIEGNDGFEGELSELQMDIEDLASEIHEFNLKVGRLPNRAERLGDTIQELKDAEDE